MLTAEAVRYSKSNCLGHRAWDPVKKAFGPYQWQDYSTVAKRRANLGAALVEVHKQVGITEQKYGVGLWCQNRPEWQIVGQYTTKKDVRKMLNRQQTWPVCHNRCTPFRSTIRSDRLPLNTSQIMPIWHALPLLYHIYQPSCRSGLGCPP